MLSAISKNKLNLILFFIIHRVNLISIIIWKIRKLPKNYLYLKEYYNCLALIKAIKPTLLAVLNKDTFFNLDKRKNKSNRTKGNATKH